MKGICRVCLQVDPTVPFFSLADEDTRNLFEECTFAIKDDTYTQLYPECHYQCLEWKKFRSKATKSHRRRVNSLSGRSGNETRTEDNHCLVCLEDTQVSKSYFLIDGYNRELFMECTAIVLVKREDNDQQRLCEDCFNICLRWSIFRSQAIDSHQKLKHLSVERLNCRVEITRIDTLYLGVDAVGEHGKSEEEHTEWAEYSIDIVKQELTVESECNLKLGESGNRSQPSSSESSDQSPNRNNRSKVIKLSNCETDQRKALDKKGFRCKECEKSFTSRGYLTIHMRIHTGEKPFKCEVCNESFRSNRQLRRHKRIHKGERPFECDVCNRAFAYMAKLVIHKRVHTGEKSFECEVCSRSFAYKSGLTVHTKMHAREKQFSCEVCSKSFGQISALTIHKRNHTEAKFFKCDICSKSFANESTLVVHKRIHTGEKPYKCDMCSKCFGQINHLIYHKRIHTGEKLFKCVYCNKSFTDSCSLIKHKRMKKNINAMIAIILMNVKVH